VYGANDPKGGADGGAFHILRSSRTNHRVEVTAGVLQAEAVEQLQRFFREKRAAAGQGGIEPAAP
jgi:tRNA(adenine34) deaminase